jgi:hypothetical protein
MSPTFYNLSPTQVKVTKILRLVKLAGLDEGLLSFSLSILVYTEHPYRCNAS